MCDWAWRVGCVCVICCKRERAYGRGGKDGSRTGSGHERACEGHMVAWYGHQEINLFY
jgi:hypothetical protein